MPLLEVKKLTKNFGGLAAVSHVDLHLETNELVGLIGPNGAGKTTLFNLLTGVYEAIEWGEALSYRSYGIIPHLPKHSVVQRSYSDGQCSDCHEQQTKRRLFYECVAVAKVLSQRGCNERESHGIIAYL